MTIILPTKSQRGEDAVLEIEERDESLKFVCDRDRASERCIDVSRREFLKLFAPLFELDVQDNDEFKLALDILRDSATTCPDDLAVCFVAKRDHVVVEFKDPERVLAVSLSIFSVPCSRCARQRWGDAPSRESVRWMWRCHVVAGARREEPG